MLILGIDPGSRVTGWGILDVTGWDARLVACGAIRTGDGPLASRLCRLADDLGAVLQDHGPQEAAIEAVFVRDHARAALVLGHARGVAMLTLARAGLEPAEYPPASVKSAITGNGRAGKDQVAAALAVQLRLRELPGPLDASDAVAVALCHAASAAARAALARTGASAVATAREALGPSGSRRRATWLRRHLAR